VKIGVLALQGDVAEHIASLGDCGVSASGVRNRQEIESVDALVIPGGESTTIAKLAKAFGVFDLIKSRIASGMPTYGSCAGKRYKNNDLNNKEILRIKKNKKRREEGGKLE